MLWDQTVVETVRLDYFKCRYPKGHNSMILVCKNVTLFVLSHAIVNMCIALHILEE